MIKEYGIAISVEHTTPGAEEKYKSPFYPPIPESKVEEAKKLLAFNFDRTRNNHPEYDLPETYEFRVGPVQETWVPTGEQEEDEVGDLVDVYVRVPDTWTYLFAWYVATGLEEAGLGKVGYA